MANQPHDSIKRTQPDPDRVILTSERATHRKTVEDLLARSNRFAEMREHAARRAEEIPHQREALLAFLDRDPDEDDDEPSTAIVGVRSAAKALSVGRRQVGRVLGGLPPTHLLSPVYVPVRGGKQAPWWENADACRSWWVDLHRSGRPAPPSRSSRSIQTVVSDSPHVLRGSIDDALDDI